MLVFKMSRHRALDQKLHCLRFKSLPRRLVLEGTAYNSHSYRSSLNWEQECTAETTNKLPTLFNCSDIPCRLLKALDTHGYLPEVQKIVATATL